MKRIVKYFLSKIFSYSEGKKSFYGFYYHLLIKSLKILEFGKGGNPLTSGERHVLKIINKLLHHRFKFYRILSWGLKAIPEEYSELNELFFCCNYLAVNRNFKGQLEH